MSQYRFIEFVSRPEVLNVWVCRNKRDKGVLGGVEFYKPWKQYIFRADETAVFSADCLRDIAHFLERKDKPI